MNIHELKTWPDSFESIANGRQRYDIRKNDRDFCVGDYLLLRKLDPKTGDYEQRAALAVQILHCTSGEWGIPEDRVVMSVGNYVWFPGYPEEWTLEAIEKYLEDHEVHNRFPTDPRAVAS